MLDFDGPICSIFAGRTAPSIAQELRDRLTILGRPVTEAMSTTDDPLQVLRLVATSEDDDTIVSIGNALRDAEVLAVETAQPTPGVDILIRRAKRRGLVLAVVSNNSREAVSRYLERAGLNEAISSVVGRYRGQSPSLLKPSPHLLNLALDMTGMGSENALLVGDSVTDVLAARAAHVPCIAYRQDPDDLDSLVSAGADAAITSLWQLVAALGSSTKEQ
jgi:HAD superfamily hydrolase (TIGR01549 family)